jgi:hypothetical protein
VAALLYFYHKNTLQMKKILFLLSFFFSYFLVQAQDLKGWHIGVTLQPYNYWLYNKQEINAAPNDIIFINPKLGIPNGFAGGFTISKYFNEKFGLTGELTYSRQRQNYDKFFVTGTYLFFRKLDYLKTPIMASLLLAPSKRGSIFINGGLQLSFLIRYRHERHTKSEIFKSSTDEYAYNTYDKGANDGEPLQRTLDRDWLYKRFQIGVLSEIGYLYAFNEIWNIKFTIRGEYDLNRAENIDAQYHNPDGSPLDAYKWDRSPILGIKREDRAKSHNIRLGVNLSLTYKLDH